VQFNSQFPDYVHAVIPFAKLMSGSSTEIGGRSGHHFSEGQYRQEPRKNGKLMLVGEKGCRPGGR
jgi:hypothetical protein